RRRAGELHGLPAGGSRGHARYRRQRALHRLRRFPPRLSDRRPAGRQRAARPVQRQALCAVLHHQARRRRHRRLRRHQAAEVRRQLRPRRASPSPLREGEGRRPDQQGNENMTSYLLAGPAEEPVSLAEARAFLKVDADNEDALITTLIGAARLHVEGVTGKALVAQSWRKVIHAWPESRRVRLPVGPVSAIAAINAVAESGASQEIGLEAFSLDGDMLLVPDVVMGMPRLQSRQGIEIDYVAGFGDAAEDVPADLRTALLGLVAHWHEHRDT